MMLALAGWLTGAVDLLSQELKAKVTIQTDRLGQVDKAQFVELEKQLSDLLSQTRWTHARYSPVERIECSFALNLLTMTDDGSYTSELHVSAQRPVYNASYMTTIWSYRDADLNFVYRPGDPIEFDSQTLTSNLVATFVFYAYCVIAADLDSFSPLGANSVRQLLADLVRSAQNQNDWLGWKPFENDYNRYALADAWNDAAMEPFRNFWYIYHRKGLDEMVANVQRGYTNIAEQMELLKAAHQARPSSPLWRVLEQTKLDELPQLFEEASPTVKEDIYKTLFAIYPTQNRKLEALKK